MLLLLLPKLLALALALQRGRAREFGGAGKMIVSTLLEMVSLHSDCACFPLLSRQIRPLQSAREKGRMARSTPRRGEPAWREACEVFGLTTLLGSSLALVTWWLTPGYFFWLLPIVLGWLRAIPLTAWSADPNGGAAAETPATLLSRASCAVRRNHAPCGMP